MRVREGHEMKSDGCFLDGVTECDQTGKCEKCRQDESAWLESWRRWNDARSADKIIAETVAAAPVRQWGVAKARKVRVSLVSRQKARESTGPNVS